MKGKINSKNLKWVDGKIEGVVYRYILTKEDAPEYGWSYVGETMTEKERIKSWRNSGNKSYGGKKCYDARKQYGWECWKYEVLERVYACSQEDLNKMLIEREGVWIKKLDSLEHGFNTSHEGTGIKGVKLTEEQRRQCGDNRRGKPLSEEAKKKISASQKGKTMSEQARKKISQKNKGKKRTAAQRQAESERLKGKTPMAATQGAKEWVKQNGGGYWKNHIITKESKARMKAAQQKRGTPVIVKAPDGKETSYPTMLDAAKGTDIKVGSVWNFIRTGRSSKNGYTYRKVN